jgi:hypothetical protein
MMTDEWTFGLLLATGHVLVIDNISSVHQAADGSIWLDVRMHQKEKDRRLEPELGETPSNLNYLLAPTERNDASINAAHVMAAFELAST